jgi:quercetin dioxygenase-like cupin family protein
MRSGSTDLKINPPCSRTRWPWQKLGTRQCTKKGTVNEHVIFMGTMEVTRRQRILDDTCTGSQRSRTMEIKRAGSQASVKGRSDWFTGTVRIDPLFQTTAPARAAGASVTFEPGARTAWHTHPLGQTLIVTAGYGWVQRAGGPIEEVRPGDVVWFPAGEKHWHGASPTTSMTHIAIQEGLNGKVVDWMEKVSDEQYLVARL